MPKCLTGQNQIHQVVHSERGLIISIFVKVALISPTVAVIVLTQLYSCTGCLKIVFLAVVCLQQETTWLFFLHCTIAVFCCHDDFTITSYIKVVYMLTTLHKDFVISSLRSCCYISIQTRPVQLRKHTE